jgi:hypothetical protein
MGYFLTLLFYPQKADFSEQMGRYIDFSKNLKLLKEVRYMSGLGQSILEEGFEKGVMLKTIAQTRKKFAKNMPLEECADMLETDVALIGKIYTALQDHPDWKDEQIYTAFFKKK